MFVVVVCNAWKDKEREDWGLLFLAQLASCVVYLD